MPARRRLRLADLSASITVFLIALPLSLGIALATGAPLQAGLVAAAIGGLVAGRFGGAPLQISGPTASLTVVTADLIHLYGWRTTCAVTAIAGLAQLVLGRLRVARSALAVSPSIVHGMLAGIGVIIAIAQLHIVLGGRPQSSPVANTLALPGQLADLHPASLSVSLLVIAVLLLWPRLPGRAGRWLRTVPAALAAVGVATVLSVALGLSVPRVELPSWSSHALAGLPQGPVLGLMAAVLTVTLVASVESLLSAVALDKQVAARPDGGEVAKADLDKELRGQGLANVTSGLLGGLPVAGVAIRSAANCRTGAVSRTSAILHGTWVLLAALLLAGVLKYIPLAALAALVMVVGVQMVKISHVRTVRKHRELLVYATTLAGVVLFGVLQGVALGIAVAAAVALHRVARTRVTVEELGGVWHVRARGQLTFLAVPRLSRALAQVPAGEPAVVELTGSFMDHAAYEALQEWRTGHLSRGGTATLTAGAGRRLVSGRLSAESGHSCRPWIPWHNHACVQPAGTGRPEAAHKLLNGVSNFQRATAPLVREELARLAREGQRPGHLFLTCADSRLVTSMITSSGPGDLFTVRNVGNLVPLPGAEDSVAAAIEYAVEVLRVESITVCGHSGCGAMQALLGSPHGSAADTPLQRWLRHGRPSLARTGPRIAHRPHTDEVEALSLANVVQQLNHLLAHACVARAVAAGRLSLHGMYFHVGEAQAYVLEAPAGEFRAVGPEPAVRPAVEPLHEAAV
ncbi:bifunctional SulP family inorganic anion transporter/carbonic anhydrase [Streptomyces sp. NPDC051940]|uniref:bifunctional SulP family inorganic anion transporter/carbonic anhydrase n=1 Tax=Streptomyces sp. NPDC051940 TaxID=3155675 RepID=UPI003438B671